nr:hypothetical protein [Mycoplasmopsis bovis]
MAKGPGAQSGQAKGPELIRTSKGPELKKKKKKKKTKKSQS